MAFALHLPFISLVLAYSGSSTHSDSSAISGPSAGPSTCGSCTDDHCDSSCCPTSRSDDPFCPNCRGANWTCLTSQTQVGMGQSPAFGGTYNDFSLKNEGFCKMQQLYNNNRTDSLGPRLLTDYRIFAGVGLSQAQFGAGGLSDDPDDGKVACGMCLEVTAKMVLWDCDLTVVQSDRFNTTTWPEQKVIVMVMDQCKDNWLRWSGDGQTPEGNCVSGHVDFDVYPLDHDVGHLQVHNLTWRAVDCPAADLPIQFLFSSTTNSDFYFGVHIWDLLVPVAKVEVLARCRNLTTVWKELPFSANGFWYQAQEICEDLVNDWPANVGFRLTSLYGEVVVANITVPTDSWVQNEEWLAFPPIVSGVQFTTSRNPPSADANAYYKHCKSNSSRSSRVQVQ